jgi:hypothetical protein
MGNVIGSYYPDYPDPFDFGQAANQYAALELLANTDPVLVPVPDDSNGEYLLLQRYVLVLLYLDTNGDTWRKGRWLKDEAGNPTCNWSGVSCPDGSSIEGLERTYNTVKTEPVIHNIRSSLTGVLFSKESYNNLSGSLPTEIGLLTTIRSLLFREWASINRVKQSCPIVSYFSCWIHPE